MRKKTRLPSVPCQVPYAEKFFGITLRLGYQAPNYAFASNINCLREIAVTAVLAQMVRCMASSFLNRGSKPRSYRFSIYVFSSIFITFLDFFLTLGIFSSIIESKHGVLSFLKSDLCYKFYFNFWQLNCQVIIG